MYFGLVFIFSSKANRTICENFIATKIPTIKELKEAISTKRPFFNPLYILYPNKMAKTISINSINYIYFIITKLQNAILKYYLCKKQNINV